MKKQDLKAGMVVEVRGGKKYLISDEKFEFIDLKDGHHFNPLDGYDDDLLFRNDGIIICLFGSGENNSDIVKVYSDYTCSNLLWERKVKPSLTEDEINLLRIINKDGSRFHWIARDGDGSLWLYEKEPRKCDKNWFTNFGMTINISSLFVDMFKFITWKDKEPYDIDELLKGADY